MTMDGNVAEVAGNYPIAASTQISLGTYHPLWVDREAEEGLLDCISPGLQV